MDATIILLLLTVVFIVLAAINARRMFMYLVSMLLLLVPIANASFMPREVFGVTGLNISNIVWLAAFGAAVITAATRKGGSLLSAYFTVPLAIFMFLYLLAAAWTLFDLEAIQTPVYEITHVSIVIENILKPLQILLSGWIVFVFCEKEGSTVTVQRVLYFVPLIIAPIAMFFFIFGSGADTGYQEGRAAISSSIGYHANELGAAAAFLLAFLLMAREQSWTLIKYLSMGATLVIIAISFSRMAYLTSVILFALTFFSLKHKEKITLAVLAGVVVIAFSAQLASRIYYGVDESNKQVDVNQVSAGRVEGIWIPMIPHFIEHAAVGSGIYSILKSPEAKKGLPIHPHNAYLQVALDMGVVGLIALSFMLARFMRLGRRNPTGFRYVVIAWMLMGLTGFSFYPMYANFIVWVSYGLALSAHRAGMREPAQAKTTAPAQKAAARFVSLKRGS